MKQQSSAYSEEKNPKGKTLAVNLAALKPVIFPMHSTSRGKGYQVGIFIGWDL